MNNDLIVIRNKIVNGTKIFLNICDLKDEKEFKNIEGYLSYFGEKYLIESVYEEIIDCEKIKNSQLYNMYLETINSKNNKYFKNAYKLKKDLALTISEHITIYRIAKDYIVDKERIVPWYYVEKEIYIADSWWETDEDIIHDINTLSFIDFLVKYKMY